MNQLKNGPSIEPVQAHGTNRNKKALAIIYMRWLFTAGIIPFYFLMPPDSKHGWTFWGIFSVVVVYNALLSLFIKKNLEKKTPEKIKGIPIGTAYFDVLLLSVLSYLCGGIYSDIFIIFLFLICYWGIRSDFFGTMAISIFSIVVYTASSILSGGNAYNEFSYLPLMMRDIFILLAAVGISTINSEVRRFDEMRRKEFKLARTDKLTGLANRHYFDQKLGEEVEYADSTGNPLNVLIFDLDNFKRFNDTYGHVWGDKLLTLFSDIIKQNIRKTDIPVRFGGEEFLILIRDLDPHMAKTVGDRIRRQLEKQRIYVGNDENRNKVTVSCGVAQYPKNSKSMKEVIDLADKALYKAKETGKNVVVSYDEIESMRQDLEL